MSLQILLGTTLPIKLLLVTVVTVRKYQEHRWNNTKCFVLNVVVLHGFASCLLDYIIQIYLLQRN